MKYYTTMQEQRSISETEGSTPLPTLAEALGVGDVVWGQRFHGASLTENICVMVAVPIDRPVFARVTGVGERFVTLARLESLEIEGARDDADLVEGYLCKEVVYVPRRDRPILSDEGKPVTKRVSIKRAPYGHQNDVDEKFARRFRCYEQPAFMDTDRVHWRLFQSWHDVEPSRSLRVAFLFVKCGGSETGRISV